MKSANAADGRYRGSGAPSFGWTNGRNFAEGASCRTADADKPPKPAT
jgi:hypothetical protein